MENLIKKKTVAVTGASGNMGRETLSQLMESDYVKSVRILLLNNFTERKLGSVWSKKYGERLTVIFGNINSITDCQKLIEDSDYVFNIAGVIPPLSDHRPDLTRDCNIIGAKNIVRAVEMQKTAQPKLVHISSVAVYGNRNYLHPWGRVGDPLLPSVYDYYAVSKVIGERYVLDSDIKYWAVVRQTAMLHMRMLTKNMKDGLMFHTCYNAPLEWLTAHDSGRLMAKIVEKDARDECGVFWNKVYNIGGGAQNRCTGFETFDDGFKIIGGSTESFMRPHWNSARNFHGMWFTDSGVLDDLFGYVTESTSDYWNQILAKHPYYKLAKIVPPSLISKFAIQRLLSDSNSPMKWIKSDDEGRIRAFFESKNDAVCITDKWDNFPLVSKNRLPDGTVFDYDEIRNINHMKQNGFLLSHGYDETKSDGELDINDMKAAAEFRGGKCLSTEMTKGDLYGKLQWECNDGHRFWASPYTVLKAGQWCSECMRVTEWDFDRQAKNNPFYAQVWYDSHKKTENCIYYFDNKGIARFKLNEQSGKSGQKAVIYVFSGTGNTAKVASVYAKEFEKHGIETTVYNISAGFLNTPSPLEFDYIGFAFPVHGFNAPAIMLDFANEFPYANKDIFIFKTSGEPLSLNNIASEKLVSILELKGYRLINEYQYVMPYNMIFRHSDGMAAKMWNTAKSRVCDDVNEITAKQPRFLDKIPFGDIIAWMFRIQIPAYKINGRYFNVDTEKCISCNECVDNCPKNNISVIDGKISFGYDCMMCARCSFNCPVNAIDIGILNNWKVNGAYNFDSEECYEIGEHANYCKKSYLKYFALYKN